VIRWLNLFCAALLSLGFGCGQKRDEAPRTGLYGELTNEPSVHPQSNAFTFSFPTNDALTVLQTELSPATLYHSTAKTLSFFANMPETGIGGPTFVAMSTEIGPKIFQPGQQIDPALMRESWFVVWFAGATNWTNWDSPWFLTLQHRPQKISFDTNGLHFTFANQAGYAALLPMYGEYKPAQLATQPLPFYQIKDKKKRVLTWEWYKALPADPLARARYWASALREFPIACDESFSVDRAHDSVTIRQSFRWLSWDDDWKTKHLKLAPVSPVLALVRREDFPVEFSKEPFDMEIFTSFGPYFGVQGVDSYDVTLPVLRYVNETAGVGTTGWSNAPCFDAWREAHASNTWDSVQKKWPVLRDQFLTSAPPDWTAFADLNSSPLDQTANALGAARLAYRLGDADTYAVACARFGRALTQLCAQQRGANYFREHQPWRSMQPIATNAALSIITADGWQMEPENAPVVPAAAPDLARLGRDAQLGKSPSLSAEKLERLIPAHSPTPFLAMEETTPVEFPSAFHLLTSAWPRLAWTDWKTPSGAPWNFGEVAPFTDSPAKIETKTVNGTRVTTYSAP